MVPRIRNRHVGNNKVQYIRNMVIILSLIAFLNLSILVSVYVYYLAPCMEETVLGCRFKHDTCELTIHFRAPYRKLMSVVCLFRSLRASSTFTSRHQLGLSTRKVLQCFWTQCVLLQQHILHPSRCLATTSCRSHLHSSSSRRPACSLGDLWRVRASRKSGKKVDTMFKVLLSEPYHVRALNSAQLGLKRSFSKPHSWTFTVIFMSWRFFFIFIFFISLFSTNTTKLEQYHIFHCQFCTVRFCNVLRT